MSITLSIYRFREALLQMSQRNISGVPSSIGRIVAYPLSYSIDDWDQIHRHSTGSLSNTKVAARKTESRLVEKA
jgi:hypothetical protein